MSSYYDVVYWCYLLGCACVPSHNMIYLNITRVHRTIYNIYYILSNVRCDVSSLVAYLGIKLRTYIEYLLLCYSFSVSPIMFSCPRIICPCIALTYILFMYILFLHNSISSMDTRIYFYQNYIDGHVPVHMYKPHGRRN